MPTPADWEWSTGARRYRDLANGRFLPNSTIIRLRNELLANRTAAVNGLAELLARGDLSVQRWTLEMRDQIRLVHHAEYVFGRGGLNAMTSADYGRLGPIVKDQYTYLQAFAEDVASGRYVADDGSVRLAGIQARARMYMGAGVNTFSRALESAWSGDLNLPAHPADGGTPCLSNCRCQWEITETRREWRAYWRLGAVEHCTGCLSRRSQWAPYRQAKPVVK